MKVYTSCYSKYRGDQGVQISNGCPKGYHVQRKIRELFPDWDMVDRWNRLKNRPATDPEREYFWTEEFVPAYWDRLENLGIERVRSMLRDGDVYLCYCTGDECHRHIFSSWLRVYGIEVEELGQNGA